MKGRLKVVLFLDGVVGVSFRERSGRATRRAFLDLWSKFTWASKALSSVRKELLRRTLT